MRDFVASVVVKGDAAGGKKALADVRSELAKTGQAATNTKKATNDLSAAQAKLGNTSRAARTGGAAATATSLKLADANRAAAGQTANLMAQLNDVGVMLAAGQNPLQLALQQGTQITQVIGPMGAAGAAKAFGGAIMGMINPVSIATIGLIAGVSALSNWAFKSDDAAKKTDRFAAAAEELEKRAKEARVQVDMFFTGAKSAEHLTKEQEMSAIRAEIRAIEATLDSKSGHSLRNAQKRIAAKQEEIGKIKQSLALTDVQIAKADRLARIQERANAAGAVIAARLKAEAAAENTGQQLLQNLQSQAHIQAIIAQHGEQSVEAAEARLTAERAAFEQTALSADMSQTLRDMLMAAWDAANGVSSVDMAGNVSLAANEAARLADNLMLAARGHAIMAASRNNPDFFDPRNESGLAGQTDPNLFNIPRTLPSIDMPPNPRKSRKRRGGGGGGGRARGTSQIEKQRNAVAQLISGLEGELDILRAHDPVQKEMLRNRETLAAATDAERNRVEELIRAREAETNAAAAQKENWETWRDIAKGAFDDLRTSGGDLGSVLDNLSDKIIDMAMNALLLGEGPLAGLGGKPGGAFGGGLINMLLGAFMPGAANINGVPKLAAGGMTYGPGSGTSDDILVFGSKGPFYASSGEFVVNAAATQRNRHLLELINAGGAIPRLASGGATDGSSYGLLGAGVTLIIENNSSAQVDGEAKEERDGRGQRSFRLVLADQVGAALTTKGGGAQRALAGSYGVKQRGTLR